MKIAICDDDKAIREQLHSLIIKHEANIDVITFCNGKDIIESKEFIDIYFLDIKMNEMTGIDVAKCIREKDKTTKNKSIIIFVTGYREYVDEAFDVNAFHYLVKPLDENKFITIFNRALKEVSMRINQNKSFVLIKYNGINRKIVLKDIYYIESNNKKVVFHTKTGDIDTYGKMDDWERKLHYSFYRCHRGYLVNLEKIVSYNVDTIELINGDKLIIAQKKYSDFIRVYMRYAKNGGIVNV